MFKYILVDSGHVIERFEAVGGKEAVKHCVERYGKDYYKHYVLYAFVHKQEEPTD